MITTIQYLKTIFNSNSPFISLFLILTLILIIYLLLNRTYIVKDLKIYNKYLNYFYVVLCIFILILLILLLFYYIWIGFTLDLKLIFDYNFNAILIIMNLIFVFLITLISLYRKLKTEIIKFYIYHRNYYILLNAQNHIYSRGILFYAKYPEGLLEKEGPISMGGKTNSLLVNFIVNTDRNNSLSSLEVKLRYLLDSREVGKVIKIRKAFSKDSNKRFKIYYCYNAILYHIMSFTLWHPGLIFKYLFNTIFVTLIIFDCLFNSYEFSAIFFYLPFYIMFV